MIFTPILISLTLLTTRGCLAAPAALDTSILKQNAQAAQSLNTAFKTLAVTDPCILDQTACISGRFAKCSANETWQTQRCSKGLKCFALPSVTSQGTVETCTSEKNALSIMNAAGVDSIFASDSSNNDGTGSGAAAAAATGTNNPSLTTTTSGDSATATTTIFVTQTIAVAVGDTKTLDSETLTLAPAAASSLLASLSSQGFTASTVSVSSSSATTVSVSGSNGNGNGGAVGGAAETVTAQDGNRAATVVSPPPTQTAECDSVTLTVTVTATPSSTPEASSGDSSGDCSSETVTITAQPASTTSSSKDVSY
ncbi:hypothetical protein BD410DRAFT_803815 [Rickenella mellea]|uniref:Carbohydrate-binding module family 19 domain-containing protein n=1 Tax=Rickenella mellea TaxID=50990 RepID=A0A4Y7Q2W6_9AGAM|nr:hypothetical protein BD410DRAFT_803815 [Rickenella mellea]